MEAFHLSVPELHCPQKRNASFVCCNQNCVLTALLCLHEQCKCKQIHPLICQYAQINLLLKQLTTRVQKTTAEVRKIVIKIDDFFVEMIRMIEFQRKKLNQTPLTILMSQQQGIFYSEFTKKPQDGPIETNGKLIKNVKRSVCSQKNTQILMEGIESYKLVTDQKIFEKKQQFTQLLISIMDIWDTQKLKDIVSSLNVPQSQINVKGSFIKTQK